MSGFRAKFRPYVLILPTGDSEMQRVADSVVRLRFLLVAAFAALVFSMPTVVRAEPTGESVRPEAPEGLENEQEERQEMQKEYVREHSDASGKVDPKAYVKGIEHARQMKVAPYIGAKPVGAASPASTK
jgi:hypothetical protein